VCAEVHSRIIQTLLNFQYSHSRQAVMVFSQVDGEAVMRYGDDGQDD
jgi:ethanolamine ammonia-lyase small subunit